MPNDNVAVRLDEETLARVDALEARISKPWQKATRSAALRAAILTGLDVLEASEAGGASGSGPAPSGGK